MPVGELLARMSSWELTEWAAFERLEGPLGGARGDVQAAIVSSTVANSNSSSGKRMSPSDFIPKWGRKRRRSTLREWVRGVNAQGGE